MIQTKNYPNGMRLIVETNPDSLASECYFSFDVGALNEKENERGYAHMLEHMLAVESSNRRSATELNKLFANCGVEPDAATSYNVTYYAFYSLNESFEKCFSAFSERIFDCSFDKAELAREQKIILQEHGDGDACPPLENLALHLHFSGNVPIAIEGDQKDIKSITIEGLKEFYKREYTPSNLTISIYGNQTFEEVESLLDKYVFCYVDKNKYIESPKRPELPMPTENNFLILDNNSIQSNVLMIFPQANKNNYAAQNLIIEMLNDYSGLLYEKLRVEEGLVYHVEADFDDQVNSFYIGFECSQKDISKCLKKIRKIFENISKTGVPSETLTSAIAKTQLSLILSSDSDKAEINAYCQDSDQHKSFEQILSDYRNVTQEQIKTIAKNILNSKFMITAQGKGIREEQLHCFDKSEYREKFSQYKNLKHLKKSIKSGGSEKENAPINSKIEQKTIEK